jgi:hypothetical protein
MPFSEWWEWLVSVVMLYSSSNGVLKGFWRMSSGGWVLELPERRCFSALDMIVLSVTTMLFAQT